MGIAPPWLWFVSKAVLTNVCGFYDALSEWEDIKIYLLGWHERTVSRSGSIASDYFYLRAAALQGRVRKGRKGRRVCCWPNILDVNAYQRSAWMLQINQHHSRSTCFNRLIKSYQDHSFPHLQQPLLRIPHNNPHRSRAIRRLRPSLLLQLPAAHLQITKRTQQDRNLQTHSQLHISKQPQYHPPFLGAGTEETGTAQEDARREGTTDVTCLLCRIREFKKKPTINQQSERLMKESGHQPIYVRYEEIVEKKKKKLE